MPQPWALGSRPMLRQKQENELKTGLRYGEEQTLVQMKMRVFWIKDVVSNCTLTLRIKIPTKFWIFGSMFGEEYFPNQIIVGSLKWSWRGI